MMSRGDVLFLLGFARHSCRARLDGVYRCAAELGMRIRVVENAYSRGDLGELIEFWKPGGIICSFGFGRGDFDTKVFGDIPVVYYDLASCTGRSVAVRAENDQIGRSAAQELLRLQYPSAAFVPFFSDLYWSRDRCDAFKAEMAASGIPCAVFADVCASSARRMQSLAAWLRSLPLPCGVFAANDLVAEEVAIAAERTGLQIPREIALIGVDNHEQLCMNLPVPLTSIQLDFEHGGYLALNKLRGLANGTVKPGGVFQYSVLKVVRRMSTRILPTPAAAFSDDMIGFIRDHVVEGVTVERVVEASGYSRRQAEKLFRAGCGKSILSAIHDAIYDQACVLLKKPQSSIDAAADMLGGISRSQIDRIFLGFAELDLCAVAESVLSEAHIILLLLD